MMNETPEAALRSRIADLEQQLKLADEGTSRLAQRCLELEKQLQTFYAAHPQRERQTDSPALVQPLLYYDAGFGFSQKDTVKAPDYEYDELNGMVTATFELPEAAFNLRSIQLFRRSFSSLSKNMSLIQICSEQYNPTQISYLPTKILSAYKNHHLQYIIMNIQNHTHPNICSFLTCHSYHNLQRKANKDSYSAPAKSQFLCLSQNF